MPSREEFQTAINHVTTDAEQAGVVAGNFVVARMWEQPFHELEPSSWMYQLGSTMLHAYMKGPRIARRDFIKPPEFVLDMQPSLAGMYACVEHELEHAIDTNAPKDAMFAEFSKYRIRDPLCPPSHPHFGSIALRDDVELEFVRSLPLPSPMAEVVGMLSKELVRRPDTNNLFPVRYSFLYQNTPVSRPELLSGVTFDRVIDDTWPKALLQLVDTHPKRTWGYLTPSQL